MNVSLFSVLLILGIVQGIIIAYLLLRIKRKLNIFLGLLVLNIALDLVATLLNSGHIYDRYPDLYFLPVNYNLGYGPLIYFVTIYFIQTNAEIKKIQYVGFVPVLIQGLFYWIVFFLPLHLKGDLYTTFVTPIVWPIEYYGTILIMAFYLASSYNYLIKNKAEIINTNSYGWKFYSIGKNIFYLFTALFVVWIFAPKIISYISINGKLDLIDILLVLTIYCLGFTVLKYNSLIKQSDFEILLNKNALKKEGAKIAIITEQEMARLITAITNLFDEQLIYKCQELSLKILADQLHSNVKTVSYVINSGMNSTFNNMVNSYRVKEVQKQIKNLENEHLTLLGIALNSGFNSKSSFNLIFKQHTGLTPKEYKSKLSQPQLSSI